jgi:excisionase family DNA binding protein
MRMSSPKHNGRTGRLTRGRAPVCDATPFATADRLLTAHEAAEMLGVQPRTLYKWAYARRLPVVKLGRLIRFRLSALMKLIDAAERPLLADGVR